jgi:hypothetical protein
MSNQQQSALGHLRDPIREAITFGLVGLRELAVEQVDLQHRAAGEARRIVDRAIANGVPAAIAQNMGDSVLAQLLPQVQA